MKDILADFIAGVIHGYNGFVKNYKDKRGEARLKTLEGDLEEKELTQEDIKKVYNKAKAPYFNVSLKEFNADDPMEGAFNLDYNIYFRNEIKKSKAFPPEMNTDERIEYWFTEVCRQIAMETYENANKTELGYPGINTIDLKDGRTEYS